MPQRLSRPIPYLFTRLLGTYGGRVQDPNMGPVLSELPQDQLIGSSPQTKFTAKRRVQAFCAWVEETAAASSALRFKSLCVCDVAPHLSWQDRQKFQSGSDPHATDGGEISSQRLAMSSRMSSCPARTHGCGLRGWHVNCRVSQCVADANRDLIWRPRNPQWRAPSVGFHLKNPLIW